VARMSPFVEFHKLNGDASVGLRRCRRRNTTRGDLSASTPRDRRRLPTRIGDYPAFMSPVPARTLETFPNPHPNRDYVVTFDAPEFTCLCPLTGQPDFAHLVIDYTPDALCVELKSLKLYLWSYRDEGAFHEDVTNRILDDIVTAAHPRWVEIEADWNIRGGIRTTVTVEYDAAD